MTLEDILEQTAKHGTRFVTVTGGEPLAQKGSLMLMKQLCDAGYQVSLETSGALDVCEVDGRVMKIMDIKTPASEEEAKNLWSNIECLNSQDELKFVICNESDYLWAKEKVSALALHEKCDVLFSPAQGQLNASELADWILRDQLPVRMQVQLHKILWGNVAGR